MQVQAIQLALPTIGVDLGIKTTNLQWLISAYSVAFGGLLLLFGRIADIVCSVLSHFFSCSGELTLTIPWLGDSTAIKSESPSRVSHPLPGSGLNDNPAHRVFVGGMVWFVIWSIACGFAQNEVSIDFFRAMQGAALGAAIVRFLFFFCFFATS